MRTTLVFLLALCVGCDGADGGDADDAALMGAGGATAADMGSPPNQGGAMAPAVQHVPCATAQKVGEFRVELYDEYTVVQGQVSDGVDPARVPGVTLEEGLCTLFQPVDRFCEPRCESGETCGDDGCVLRPVNIDLGEVTVTGLTDPVAMTARAPVFFYSHRGDLAHPAFAPGDALGLAARGGPDDIDLDAVGVHPLAPPTEVPRLERTQALSVNWSAPAGPSAAMVHLELNIANHGGTPAWIHCVVPDTGSHEIAAPLITQLLDLGFSGYPSLSVSRRTIDSTTISKGCVEFLAVHTMVSEVEIPGLVSCSDDAECPEGQTCRVDLTCG